MQSEGLVEAYFARWNAHDVEGVKALFAPEGRYEDPMTGGAIGAEGLGLWMEQTLALFPDLRFVSGPQHGEGKTRVVEWKLQGTNLGPLHVGIEPTEKKIALKGVDVFELSEEGIVSVRGYFDQKTMVEQMGLMALVQPIEQGAARFGYSMRVASGNPKIPQVIALTWIRGRDEAERDRIRGHSRQIVKEFMEEPGFVGIVTGFTGDRGFTVTAWEDEEALQRGLAQEHAFAMKELRSQDFVPGVWTSVWKPIRINRVWTRCPACNALEDVSDDHRQCSQCDAILPERPPIW